MAYLLGALVGGLILIYLLAAFWEWAVLKRVLDDPLKGKLGAVGAGWLTAGGIAGFGMADGGPYYWPAFLTYLPGAFVLAFFAYKKGLRLREAQPEIAETFA